jgi:hypothetical protein
MKKKKSLFRARPPVSLTIYIFVLLTRLFFNPHTVHSNVGGTGALKMLLKNNTKTHHNFAQEINCNLCEFFSLFSKTIQNGYLLKELRNLIKKFSKLHIFDEVLLLNFTEVFFLAQYRTFYRVSQKMKTVVL